MIDIAAISLDLHEHERSVNTIQTLPAFRRNLRIAMNPPGNHAIDILEMIRPLSAFTVGMTDIIDNTFGTQDAGDAEILGIMALIRDGPLSTSDLRQQSGLSRRACDRLTRQLAESGLIERAQAPHDQRVRVHTLTRRGRTRARELERRLTDYFGRSRAVADEILTRLGEPADAPNQPQDDARVDPLDFVARMSSLGHRLDVAIRAQHAPQHPKNRDQIALLMIANGDPSRPSQLAHELTLTTGGMTRVLNKLEADGLIERHHGQTAGDRRAVHVALTADGREVIAAIATGFASIKSELRALFSTVAAFAATNATAT